MSQYVTSPAKQALIESKWGIRDSEFLLRLIMTSKIDGADLEVASDVVKKIKELHARIVAHKVAV